MKDRGLEIVAVNAHDPEARIQKYAAANHFTFPIVMGGSDPMYAVGKAYGIYAYPTNYLVDAETGKILWRGVGFDEPGLRGALKKAGL